MSPSMLELKVMNQDGCTAALIEPTTIRCGRRVGFLVFMSMGCMMWVGGCQKVLFPESEPRNQFERSDNLRDRFTPVTEPDVFGNPKPALRARLSPPTG